MTKAYGYVRCSGPTQLEMGGPDRQRESIQEYAGAQGIEIVRWFIESHTGTDLEGRPEFREMRRELLSDGIRVVIVEKLDRMARDILIQETIIGDFKRNGIELRSATKGEEDLCGSDPTRIFIRQVLGAVAQFDRAMLVSRMAAGKKRVKATGQRCGGNRPYPDPRRPEEQAIVDRIRRLAVQQLHSNAIAHLLNLDGVRTRKGTAFSAMQIHRILKAG